MDLILIVALIVILTNTKDKKAIPRDKLSLVLSLIGLIYTCFKFIYMANNTIFDAVALKGTSFAIGFVLGFIMAQLAFLIFGLRIAIKDRKEKKTKINTAAIIISLLGLAISITQYIIIVISA